MTIHTEPPAEQVPFLYRLGSDARMLDTSDDFEESTIDRLLDDDGLRHALIAFVQQQSGAAPHRAHAQLHFLMACREIQHSICGVNAMANYANGHVHHEAAATSAANERTKMRSHLNWQCWEMFKAFLASPTADGYVGDLLPSRLCDEFSRALVTEQTATFDTLLSEMYQ